MEGFVLDALAQRIIIIGNSGSGKSTLAAQIAGALAVRHVGLDEIYWIDQTFLKKRGQAEALGMVREVARAPAWVIEGVFGWLVDVVSPRATLFVWLDLPWEDCEAGLLKRGPVYGADASEFNGLLAWAQLYCERKTSSSRAGHRKIFDAFQGPKLKLGTRAEVDAFGAAIGVASAGSLAVSSVA
jgi:adenylate kinase family enzyme